MLEMNGFDFFGNKPKNVRKIVVLTALEVITAIELMKANLHLLKLVPKPLSKLH